MSKTTFLQVAAALSTTVGFVQAGIISLPIEDAPKAFIAFGLGIAATFLASFLKAQTP